MIKRRYHFLDLYFCLRNWLPRVLMNKSKVFTIIGSTVFILESALYTGVGTAVNCVTNLCKQMYRTAATDCGANTTENMQHLKTQ